MRFDGYGRFQLEIIREGDQWRACRLEQGRRILAADLVIPSEVASEELATYLDDPATGGFDVRLLLGRGENPASLPYAPAVSRDRLR
jgi:hypothetical protein